MSIHKQTQEAYYSKGQNDFISALKNWHNKISENQIKIENEFNFNNIDGFSINIYDDFIDNESTFAYVDITDIPDSVCFDLLNYICEAAKTNKKIINTGLKFRIRFYDATTIYPILINDPDCQKSLYKRWEIVFFNANSENIEIFISELKLLPAFNGKLIKLYSES